MATGERSLSAFAVGVPSRLFHALISHPTSLFLAALTIILFRPPDLPLYEMDRIAVFALTFFVAVRALLLRQSFRIFDSVSLPLLGLVILAFCRVVSQPYDPQNWSVFAAKWLVPFLFFHIAGQIFADQASLRKFEVFCWIALSYLSLTAFFFLLGWKSLIFPRFILDEGLGIHADRARGPFLQAVANGVALNLLALVALDSFRRRRLPRLLSVFFFGVMPFAILATKTRAVWLSFAFSVSVLAIVSKTQRIRRACIAGLIVAAVGLSVALATIQGDRGFSDRFEEASPVEFRMAVYQAGWELFQERPIFGWSAADVQTELERTVEGIHEDVYYFHNTFLEVAVSYGCVGLGLYLWLLADLFLLARQCFSVAMYPRASNFLDAGFRSLWPMLLVVYILNACFVVMNYQFVNGLIFALAGMLAAQDYRLKHGVTQAVAPSHVNVWSYQQT
ncbi:MAG TPA: O-antigen ligase family protein [Terriglobales bacterium]|nr:O-antigen ligase family protein [Terriglobales bacterium]